MANNEKIKEVTRFTYPKEVSEFPAYLEITLKTLSNGNFINRLKDELISTAKSVVQFGVDVAGVVGDAGVALAKDAYNFIVPPEKQASTETDKVVSSELQKAFNGLTTTSSYDYFNGDPKLKFITYIPRDFESTIVSTWAESELFGGVNFLLNNLDKTPTAGSLIGPAYNALKNNAQALSKVAITPKMVKLFQPSFFDFDLNFTFVPDTPQENKNLLSILRCFQESQRPSDQNNSELYTFPAVFDVKIILNDEVISQGGKINISTKSGDGYNIWNHITTQRGYGLTNITITPKSGDAVNMVFRQDGMNVGYDVKMSFTSLRRMYNTHGSVNNKISSLLANIDKG